MSIETGEIYTAQEVADFFKLSLRTVRRMLAEGRLASFRAEGRVRITGQALHDYIENNAITVSNR